MRIQLVSKQKKGGGVSCFPPQPLRCPGTCRLACSMLRPESAHSVESSGMRVCISAVGGRRLMHCTYSPKSPPDQHAPLDDTKVTVKEKERKDKRRQKRLMDKLHRVANRFEKK